MTNAKTGRGAVASRIVVFAWLCAFAACTGAVGGSGNRGDQAGRDGSNHGGPDDDSPGNGTGGSGSSGSPGPAAMACRPGADGLTLRRLTRDEFDNTLRDLLGDVSNPGRSFPADISSLGFDNNVSTLTLPPVLTEQYEAATEKVIEQAWMREATMPASDRRLRRCELTAGKEAACARQVLEAFVPLAWRRPAKTAEIDHLMTALAVAKMAGDTPLAGLKLALQSVLLSPHFLFRIEADADVQTLEGQYALASRLSYFLWGSMPDAPLFDLAAQRKLSDKDTLAAQVKRMLSDPKAKALTLLFAGQWLDLRFVESANPDGRAFPDFSPELKRAMRAETEKTFEALLQEDRSALDLLDADFSFMNESLAQHYELWDLNVTSKDLTRVTFPSNRKRAGLFGQGSFSLLTSMPDRTSIIKRGDWVLNHLTCEPPPPPPANVPPLKPSEGGAMATSVRERTEQHRADPACAGCHAVMDPIGFGLENYDAIGRWRDREEGSGAIDATGDYKGKRFNGPLELGASIKADPAFASCIVEKVYTYALGKSKGDEDEAPLEELTAAFASKQHRLAALFTQLATSSRFLAPCGSKM